MKKGQTVTIFTDPITRQKTEGIATLVRREFIHAKGYEYWMVSFPEDNKTLYGRFIATDAYARQQLEDHAVAMAKIGAK